METYKEVKEIAKTVSKLKQLIKRCNDKYDMDDWGVDWSSSELVSLGKEDIEYFKTTNGVTDEYYVVQHTGYLGDDYYGKLWFKTDVPGQYVRVNFSC